MASEQNDKDASSSGAPKDQIMKMPALCSDWDPTDNNIVVPPQFLRRIQVDLQVFYTDPLPDIFLVPDSGNISVAHAIIVGPADTPYEGGFFYFYMKLPSDYPLSPPKVKLMTTDQNTVRFNPNLYNNGKVCLSLLGTWSGPGWCAANSLRSVLLSIQSIMNEKPYYNEPGHEAVASSKSASNLSMRYNDIIRHETIRVAVIGMMEENSNDSRNMPAELREKITEVFKAKISFYEKVISENSTLDGRQMMNPFIGCKIGIFMYMALQVKIDELKKTHVSEVGYVEENEE